MTSNCLNQRSRVYFAQAQWGGRIKIGCSFNVAARMQALAGPLPFDLIEIGSFYGEQFQEQFLHAWFASCRWRGEWFDPTPELWRAAMEARTSGVLTWVPCAEIRLSTFLYRDYSRLLQVHHISSATLAAALGNTVDGVELSMKSSAAAPAKWLAAFSACVRKFTGRDFNIDVTHRSPWTPATLPARPEAPAAGDAA